MNSSDLYQLLASFGEDSFAPLDVGGDLSLNAASEWEANLHSAGQVVGGESSPVDDNTWIGLLPIDDLDPLELSFLTDETSNATTSMDVPQEKSVYHGLEERPIAWQRTLQEQLVRDHAATIVSAAIVAANRPMSLAAPAKAPTADHTQKKRGLKRAADSLADSQQVQKHHKTLHVDPSDEDAELWILREIIGDGTSASGHDDTGSIFVSDAACVPLVGCESGVIHEANGGTLNTIQQTQQQVPRGIVDDCEDVLALLSEPDLTLVLPDELPDAPLPDQLATDEPSKK